MSANCMKAWNLEREVTMDETMVKYKGKYFYMCQYIKNKLVKFGIKIWCVAGSTTSYLWSFLIYCGAFYLLWSILIYCGANTSMTGGKKKEEKRLGMNYKVNKLLRN